MIFNDFSSMCYFDVESIFASICGIASLSLPHCSTVSDIPVEHTVEPLNKGHIRTEGIVPYSEVVPYWEVSQKK